MSKETYNYKRSAIKAEKELFYPKEIILRLESVTTEGEIERIMNTPRKRY